MRLEKGSSEVEIEQLKEVLADVFRYFDDENGTTSNTTTNTSTNTSTTTANVGKYGGYYTKVTQNSNSIHQKSELQQYLEDPVLKEAGASLYKLSKTHQQHRFKEGAVDNGVLVDDFDILLWWRTCGRQSYPNVWRMARAFLAIQGTSVAAESIFSNSGRIVSTHRCSLLPETVTVLMLLQNWIKAILQYSWKIDDIDLSLFS